MQKRDFHKKKTSILKIFCNFSTSLQLFLINNEILLGTLVFVKKKDFFEKY